MGGGARRLASADAQVGHAGHFGQGEGGGHGRHLGYAVGHGGAGLGREHLAHRDVDSAVGNVHREDGGGGAVARSLELKRCYF